MTAKKNWKLDWYDAVASDKRVDPAAFKVAYCMRRNLPRRTLAAKVDDKVLSKMTGISVAEVKRARETLEHRGWITEWIEPNSYSFMGDYLAEQRDADQRKSRAAASASIESRGPLLAATRR